MKKTFNNVLLLGITILFFCACGNTQPKENKETTVQEEPVVLVPVIDEEMILDIPMIPVAPEENATKTQEKQTVIKTKHTAAELRDHLTTVDIIPTQPIVDDTTFFAFSESKLNAQKTVVSYEKKGEEVLKVISDPTDSNVIDYIVFTDRKDNVDIYGVSAGMTAKETRHLRNDLKHFIKKGKIFLYNEDSNILYQLDGVTSEDEPVTQELIDEMNVSAIIWKDKNDKPAK